MLDSISDYSVALSSTSFPVHYLRTMLPLEAILCDLRYYQPRIWTVCCPFGLIYYLYFLFVLWYLYVNIMVFWNEVPSNFVYIYIYIYVSVAVVVYRAFT
jgi:hypothetical protein